MQIAITGGTGLVGSALTGYLTEQGHHVYILTRNTENKQNTANITFVKWLTSGSEPEYYLSSLDAIINLAGATLSKPWTTKHKKLILHSRIQSAREVVRLIQTLPKRPHVLINASAVGFYGPSNDLVFDEFTRPAESNYLQHVCQQWEKEAAEAEKEGIRTIYARFGLILDNNAGVLPKISWPYKAFIGGPIGDGQQWYSWIHLRDAVESLLFLMNHREASGPVNITAPQPVTMNNFGLKLAGTLNRPHWIPIPSKLIKTALGEMSSLVIEGQHVIPSRLLSYGYSFYYPELGAAFSDLFNKKRNTQ